MMKNLDIILVIIQCFFLYLFMYLLEIAPIANGIADYQYSKHRKKVLYIINLVAIFALLFGGWWLITSMDKGNTIAWYIITVITIVPSCCILVLDIDNYAKPIKHPSKLKEYICNARYEILKGKSLKVLRIGKGLIYGYYIAVMILNQIGDLYDNCLSNSLYLKINEYSLIILFAIVQMKNEVGKKS